MQKSDPEKDLLYSLLRYDYLDASDIIEMENISFNTPKIDGSSVSSGGIDPNFNRLSGIIGFEQKPFYIGLTSNPLNRLYSHSRKFQFDKLSILFQTEKMETAGNMEEGLLYRFRKSPLLLNRSLLSTGITYGREKYFIYMLRGASRRFR